jgi:hypothetical protein
MDTNNLHKIAEELLENAKITGNILTITPIYEGGNNQLYRLKHIKQNFILKNYFNHPSDRRDRLTSEYRFLQIAYKRCPESVPRPFSKTDKHSAALYEYVDGSKFYTSDEVKPSHIYQAANFIRKLNADRTKNQDHIENASEACFSIDDHIQLIQSRVNEFNLLEKIDSNLMQILKTLNIMWDKIRERTYSYCHSNEIPTSKILPLEKRILSPSDFGFHNAILRRDNLVTFLDFEYAGWDDPSKMIGDFFSQVAIPIESKFLDAFLENAFDPAYLIPEHKFRLLALIDAYKIKWCCIILNIFLDKHLTRRLFSNPSINIETFKINQLKKANYLLESLIL